MFVGGLEEEGMFSGATPLLAPIVGLPPLWAVAYGSAWWAYLHGTGRAVVLSLTGGWLYAALWLAGQWPIAIGLHVGTNVVAAAVQIHRRKKE